MKASFAASALMLALCTLAGCGAPGAVRDEREPVTASDLTDTDRRARARIELASAYFSRGQMETALDEVKLALQARPDLVEAYNLRGLIHAAMGDSQLAEASYKHALQIQARDADTLHNYGWFLCQQKRFDESWLQFQAALAQPQYRGAARTFAAKGICQTRAGLWLEAEGSFMRSFELDPADPSTAMSLSEVLYRRGDFERARFYVARVNAQVETTNAQSLWLALRIENKLGNTGRVSEFGAQLQARYPQSPESARFERRGFDE
jgi:type IV pilus assembly protein PilF